MKKLFWVLLVVAALSLTAIAQKDAKKGQKAEDASGTVKISVVKAMNGKPVRNALVVLHSIDKDGQQSSGGINLKTDQEGQTGFDGLPYGKLRIQVIARGYQTYGEDFDINQAQQEITIKLKPPAGQVSIYEDKPTPSTDKKPE